MALGKRTIGLVTVICVVMVCLFTIPSFASSSTDPIQALPPIGTTSVTESSVETEPSTKTENVSDAAEEATSTDTGSTADSASSSTTDATDDAKADDAKAEDDESLWYRSKISMKKEHQKLLWDYCKKRNLGYIDMLALIALESNFNEKCSSKRCKGYFQISTIHGPNLSKTLKTLNKPLDGAININWGTAMYSWILVDKRVKGMEGKELRDAALSIFQRGGGGYDKYGINKSYLKKYYKKRDIIVSYFEN